jgi:hypothetical protein
MKLTRILIGALSLSLVVFSVLAFGQVHLFAAGHQNAVYHATWLNHPVTMKDARTLSSAIVLARVTEVRQAADIVVPAAGEPNGEDRVPTQRIRFEVAKTYAGKIDTTFTLFHTGTDTRFIDGDPPYKLGETYVLFVQPKADAAGEHIVISPEGRFRLSNNRVEAMAHEGYATGFHGKSLVALERALAQH